MRIYHSPKHKLRDAKFEISAGEIVAPFEKPSRMEFILAELEKRNFNDVVEPKDHGMETAAKLHRADYLEFMAGAYEEWRAMDVSAEAFPFVWPSTTMRADKIPQCFEGRIGYYCLSSDTGISEGTWEAALSAKDCAMAAAAYLHDEQKPAFALARPPGHHASSYQYGGYCFLNNAAIAAQRLLDLGANRVSIFDVDFHHGNGTQEIFYARDDVQFLSIHGDPMTCFPYFLGHADERGEGRGEGHNFNYPLPKGTGYSEWLQAFDLAMKKIADYAPDALVISLGVDTFEGDPISAFKLKSEDFFDFGTRLAKAKLPTMFVMEGGYAVEEIGVNTVNVIEGFMNG